MGCADCRDSRELCKLEEISREALGGGVTQALQFLEEVLQEGREGVALQTDATMHEVRL
jgi:hypothetical protein